MAENGRVHPNCVNASNPYHECGMACLEKISQGHGRPERKISDISNGIKEGAVFKKKDEGRKVHPNCDKASNPYHECGEFCSKRNGETNVRGVRKDSGSWSFGRKKKVTETQPNSPRVGSGAIVAPSGYRSDAPSPRTQTHISSKKKVESEIEESTSSSEQQSAEIYPHNHSFNKGHVRSFESVPTPGKTDRPKEVKEPPKDMVVSLVDETPTKHEKDEKLQTSSEIQPHVEDDGETTESPVAGLLSFTFSGINRDLLEDSDDEEVQSVISDSCVSVGKYHVKASVSTILQSVIDTYGDIAENCKLKSVSMKAYYLECLCGVVQELQSTPVMQMTKAKVREWMAVLKDVESAQIDVSWLRNILDEISEAIDLITQHQTIETAKTVCDKALESVRKELETQMKELADKEKQVDVTKARLRKLESESSNLDTTMLSIKSKVEKVKCKPLADELV